MTKLKNNCTLVTLFHEPFRSKNMKASFSETGIVEQIKIAKDQFNQAWSHYVELVGATNAGPKPGLLSKDPEDNTNSMLSYLEELIGERDTVLENIEASHNEMGNRLNDATSRLNKFEIPTLADAPKGKAKTKPRTAEQKEKRNATQRAKTAALREKQSKAAKGKKA